METETRFYKLGREYGCTLKTKIRPKKNRPITDIEFIPEADIKPGYFRLICSTRGKKEPFSSSPFRSKATPIWLLVIINLLIIVYATIVIVY